MESIVLPEKVVLRLVDPGGNPVRLQGVLFNIHVFAKRKNDFHLGPFITNDDGISTISKRDLLAGAEAHYDTGLMDYHNIQDSKPDVLIVAMTQENIDQALLARTKVWTSLLSGEAERWKSIDNLRNCYRNATNNLISATPLKARWDGTSGEYEYSVLAAKR